MAGSTAQRETLRIPTRLGTLAVRAEGAGHPTVLWHSMFVDGTSWSRLTPLLAAGRRLLVVDGPGWGASDPLRRVTDVSASVGAADDVLRALATGPVDWVGNAWGGHVGMELAATRPALVRSLVAISAPAQPIDDALRKQIRMLIPVLRLLGPVGPVRSAIVEGQLTDASRQDPAVVQNVVGALRRARRGSMATTVRSFILNRVDIAHLLPSIAAPALFVSGDDRGDWTPEQARDAAALAPNARAVTVPSSRTLVPLEQPEALAAAIRTFWEDVDRS